MGGVFCLAMLLVFVSCSPSSNNGLIIVQPPKTASPEAVASAVDIAGIVEDAANKKPGIDITSVKDATVTYDSFVALSQTADPEPTPTSKSIEMIIGFSGYDNGSATISGGQMEITFTGTEDTGSIAIDSFTATITQNLTVKLNGTAKTYSVGGAEIKGSITATAASSTATADIAYTFSNASGASLALTSSITVGGRTVNASGISGDGDSAGSAMTFTTADQLVAFAKSVNDGSIATEGKYFALGADIDLSGIDWEPIGTKTNPFKGSFNGNGYSISNIKIKSTTESENDDPTYIAIGFFGLVKPDVGTTSSFTGITIASGSIESVALCAGGIIGRTEGAGDIEISGCVNSASVSSNNCSGGIVGLIWGDADTKVNISSSANHGEIYAEGKEIVNPSDNYSEDGKAGGIVGAKHSSQGTLTIEGCRNDGHVHGGNAGAGGILGYAGAELSITGCTNDGTIGGSDTRFAGGISGYQTAANGVAIIACTNNEAISAYERAGGIIGTINFGFWTGTYPDLGNEDDNDISSNTNNGDISITIDADGSQPQNSTSHAGGIAGYVSGVATDKSGTGTGEYSFTMNGNASNGAVSGATNAGGLIGFASNRIGISGSNVGNISIASAEDGNAGSLIGSCQSTAEYNLDLALTGTIACTETAELGYAAGSLTISKGTLTKWPEKAAENTSLVFATGTATPNEDDPAGGKTYTYSGSAWSSN